MATNVVTIEDLADKEVTESAKKALGDQTPFWKGVQWFIDWLRTKVADFFKNQIGRLPIVGRWAARIGTTVTELLFTVIGTFIHFLSTVFSSGTVWKTAHGAALKAWQQNEGNGLLAQIYAYGKKMAAYFLEIIRQCFERAIKAHGLEVSADEKTEIGSMLDNLLD